MHGMIAIIFFFFWSTVKVVRAILNEKRPGSIHAPFSHRTATKALTFHLHGTSHAGRRHVTLPAHGRTALGAPRLLHGHPALPDRKLGSGCQQIWERSFSTGPKDENTDGMSVLAIVPVARVRGKPVSATDHGGFDDG